MEILKAFLPNFAGMITLTYELFIKGGWVLFLISVVYMLYKVYKEEIEHQFLLSIEWVFLEIKPPKENLVSTLAVENIFSQMHVLHRGLSKLEIYVEGQFQMWYSLEIVSFGGTISFIVRVPKKYQNLCESAIYSQYPDAEIREISDYMENFNYDPDNKDYEIFGTEFKLLEDTVIPLRTYKDFEHTSAEEKIIDPLSNVFQSLERLKPHEFFGVQMLIQPVSDKEWHSKADKRIKKLTGEQEEHDLSFWDFFMIPFNAFAKFSYKKTLLGGHSGHAKENAPKNNWLNMTEGQKERVSLIEKKMIKPAYNTKIRHLYISEKSKYDKVKRFEMIGAYKPLNSGFFNTLKNDGRVWTKVDPVVSPALEDPYLKWEMYNRKKKLIRGYKNRSLHVGSAKFILNVEEIATLFHFPITIRPLSSSVQAVSSKKIQPPADLPIAE